MSHAIEFQTDVSIVLTATITPNVTGPASTNPETRLAEYRRVLQFYRQFAPVFFLENSRFPLESDPDFTESPNLRVRRFAPSSKPERGKGYQEFEMLDAWLAAEPQPPPNWLKITGRYQLRNLCPILNECRRERKYGLLIDQLAKQRFARTHLFFSTTQFYREQIEGLYRQCDDSRGEFIEHVMFRQLEKLPRNQVRIFKTQPDFLASLGSTGKMLPTGSFQWLTKQGLRRLNYLINKRRLLYVR